TQLVLTEDQARLVRAAKGPIQVADPAGNIVAHAQPVVPLDQLDPIDREAVEQYLRRRHEPKGKCYSSEHVHAMLEALEQEWQRTGGLDEAYMHKFVEAFRAEDAR